MDHTHRLGHHRVRCTDPHVCYSLKGRGHLRPYVGLALVIAPIVTAMLNFTVWAIAEAVVSVIFFSVYSNNQISGHVPNFDALKRSAKSKKSRAVLCQGGRVEYRFINEHTHRYGLLRWVGC